MLGKNSNSRHTLAASSLSYAAIIYAHVVYDFSTTGRFVSGETARCWEVRRISGGNAQDDARALAEANAAGPPAVVEVFSPFSPGSPASRTLQTPREGFGSPAAARAKAKVRAAAAAMAAVSALSRRPAVEKQREPLYDALHLDPQVCSDGVHAANLD